MATMAVLSLIAISSRQPLPGRAPRLNCTHNEDNIPKTFCTYGRDIHRWCINVLPELREPFKRDTVDLAPGATEGAGGVFSQ